MNAALLLIFLFTAASANALSLTITIQSNDGSGWKDTGASWTQNVTAGQPAYFYSAAMTLNPDMVPPPGFTYVAIQPLQSDTPVGPFQPFNGRPEWLLHSAAAFRPVVTLNF